MPLGPVQAGLAQRMGGGGAPPPGPPPGMAGPPPGPGGPQMDGPPPGMEGGGGDLLQQIAEHLQAALMLTVQAGPEAFGMGGIKKLWTGVFGALDQRMPQPQGQQGMPPAGPPPGAPPQMGPPPGMAGPPPGMPQGP